MRLGSSKLLATRETRTVPSTTTATQQKKKGSCLARACLERTTTTMRSRIRSPPTTTKALPLPATTTTTTTTSTSTSTSVGTRRLVTRASSASSSSSSSPPTSSSDIRRRVVILPGLGNSDADYEELAASLRARGAAVRVARVSRIDWARNAAGLLRTEYWTGKLTPRPTVDWYLGRIDEALKLLDEEVRVVVGGSGGGGADSSDSTPLPPLTLLAHSAGGWLGRVWMLSENESDKTRKKNASLVSSFVSVGSPHNPPPPSSPIPDQTRGILTWCERETPGAFHAEDHGVEYTTIAARYVKGAPLFGSVGGGGGSSSSSSSSSVDESTSDGDGNGNDSSSSLAVVEKVTIAQRLAGFGYEAVCGDATAWGDGIVPVETAHLEGAQVATLTLDGVYHSPLGADEGAGRPWYGSEGVLELWVDAVFGGRPKEERERAL